ncbi:hypothetical protein B566_EDAN015007, partial [Ephemera danica]
MIWEMQYSASSDLPNVCCSLGIKWRVLNLESLEKMTCVEMAFRVHSQQVSNFHVRGSDVNCPGKFRWCETNTFVNPKVWLPQEPRSNSPGKDCLMVRLQPAAETKSGVFTTSCYSSFRFICEGPQYLLDYNSSLPRFNAPGLTKETIPVMNFPVNQNAAPVTSPTKCSSAPRCLLIKYNFSKPSKFYVHSNDIVCSGSYAWCDIQSWVSAEMWLPGQPQSQNGVNSCVVLQLNPSSAADAKSGLLTTSCYNNHQASIKTTKIGANDNEESDDDDDDVEEHQQNENENKKNKSIGNI